MKHLALICAIVILQLLPVRADTDASAIETVITEQIEAFRADDFERAFSYASPTIQRLFGTPDNFGLMVQQGYPMVYRPAGVRFLDLAANEQGVMQRVLIRDQSGVAHVLIYDMVVVDDRWRINAVYLEPAPDVGA